MPPAAQADYRLFYDIGGAQGARDTPTNIFLVLKKRQDPSMSSQADFPAQDTPTLSATLPASSSPLATSSQSSSYPSSAATPSLGPVSTKQSPSSEHTVIVILGVIGGAVALLLFGYAAFRLLRRHQEKTRRRMDYVSFWENWNWGAYSPVDGDVVNVNHGPNSGDDSARKTTKASSDRTRVSSYTWWQKSNFRPVPEAPEGEEKKKNSRPKTMYKVRSFKPGEGFDIDSCASSGPMDLK